MMKTTTKCVLAGLVINVLLSVGCNVGRTSAHVADAGKLVMMSQNLGPTMTHSTSDHMHQISTVIDRDRRAFIEDLDMLYQTDRPTRLTRWHDR